MIPVHPLDDERFVIHFPYYSQAAQKVSRGVPGIEYKGSNRYEGYADAMALFLEGLRARGLRGLGDVPERTESDRERVRPLGGFLKKLHDGTFVPIMLRSYQVEGADYLIDHGEEGCILGDGMRLGKTAQAVMAARRIADGGTCLGKDTRILIVCPAYVRGVWHDEFEKWWPPVPEPIAPIGHGRIYSPQGHKTEPIPSDVQIVIIHYDIVHKWADVLTEWAPTIAALDECHMLQSENTLRAKAIRQVFASGVRWRWGLSGTPQTNRVRDLWNVVDTLCPGRFGKFFLFGLRYCAGCQVQVTPIKKVWNFDGASNAEELSARLKHFMLRRLAQDVALELPPKTRQTIWIDLPAKKAIGGDYKTKRQLREALDRSADAKLPAVVEILRDHLVAGRKLIAFCWRRQVAEHLREQLEGFETYVIHGGVSNKERGRRIAFAQQAAGAVALIVTIDSTQVGIDLSFAEVATFVELTWEPHELLQAEARGIKYGDGASGLLIEYVLARGSADEIIAGRVIEKLESFERIIGSTGESLDTLRGSAKDAADEIVAALGLG